MKKCLINQPAGIGDVLFCQKIAKKTIEQGYSIVWPIKPSIMFMVDYIKCDNIEYINNTSSYKEKIDKRLNLDLPRNKYRIMERKYKESGIDDFSDWSDYLLLNRNYEKEKELMEHLKIKGDFSFVNRNYGTPPNFLKHNFKCTPKYPVVEMDFIEGFNVFDWCGVLENSSEIFTIDTCINIFIEKLQLKTRELHTYSRRKDFSEVDYMFSLDWNYHL